MRPKFREDKTTQAASIFLSLGNGQMNYMKLIKLLYIADREALFPWGRPISFDAYVSMDRGPVLSRTLDLITEEAEPGEESYWRSYISEPTHYAVRLFKECQTDELSEAEINLIHDIFKKYGAFDQWKLVDIVHQFGEWQNPQGSAIPIEYSDILRAGKKTPIEVSAILDELESLAFMDNCLL